jgi:sortase (surface protein transpeptidase)
MNNLLEEIVMYLLRKGDTFIVHDNRANDKYLIKKIIVVKNKDKSTTIKLF